MVPEAANNPRTTERAKASCSPHSLELHCGHNSSDTGYNRDRVCVIRRQFGKLIRTLSTMIGERRGGRRRELKCIEKEKRAFGYLGRKGSYWERPRSAAHPLNIQGTSGARISRIDNT